MIGKVYKSTGSWYKVKSPEGVFLDCCIKGKLRIANSSRSTNPIVVGDLVDYQIEATGHRPIGIIKDVCERRNFIVRKSVNLSKEIHILAANIDRVFLVVTLKEPETPLLFIDRFLLMAEAYGVEAVLVFNKTDLYNAEDLKVLDGWQAIYSKIGYQCLKTSAAIGQNIDALKSLMAGKVCMFSGRSGVGKSKLITAMEPSLHLKIGDLSHYYEQGKHTTTFAQMFDLSFGGSIVDTPGIRGIGITRVEREEVGRYFTEFFKLQPHCKYHNCLHLNEPLCAVKDALAEGHIAPSRYESYLQITSEDDSFSHR